MRTFDLTPFYRSTIGFDQLFSRIVQGASSEPVSYPPYNIERYGDDQYRITIALSGFKQEEISIQTKENTLLIKGEKTNEKDQDREILHQGIASRAFERAFHLADYVHAVGASMEDGLLHIDLKREIPEAKKPRMIPISRNQ